MFLVRRPRLLPCATLFLAALLPLHAQQNPYYDDWANTPEARGVKQLQAQVAAYVESYSAKVAATEKQQAAEKAANAPKRTLAMVKAEKAKIDRDILDLFHQQSQTQANESKAKMAMLSDDPRVREAAKQTLAAQQSFLSRAQSGRVLQDRQRQLAREIETMERAHS